MQFGLEASQREYPWIAELVKGTPFDWTPQIKEKLLKAIHFVVNLPESCVFIYIFDIFDLDSPKSCVFINIFDIFDIWRSLCNWVSKTSQREYPWIAELVKGYSL